MTGTGTDIGARLRALTPAGITEVAYQPMGPDIPRELTAFARAAGLAGREAGKRMTTLVRLAKRAAGSSIDDFQRQADGASDWSAAAPYGLRGATQALTLPGAYRRGEPACDVIDELAFDDEASVARCLADPAFRRAWASPLLDPASVASWWWRSTWPSRDRYPPRS